MRQVIHPDYTDLTDGLLKLAHGEYSPVKTFCNNRNKVDLASLDGKPVVVKKYKRTNLLTGIIYTFFRKSKARRAYEHALRLLSLGISTPFPIAYIEESRWGIFRDGYFISEYVDLPAVTLHMTGIIPLDYNTTNILFEKTAGRYKFTLIDINRMKIGRVPKLKEAMRSFFQLGTYPHDYLGLLEPYVWERGFNFEDALYHVIRHRRNQIRLRKIKRFFKPKRQQ